MKNKILVVVPYCSQGAQGRELEYSVAGWRKHFKEPYLIVLAGEYHPVVETGNDIVCIESPRVPEKPGQYRQHLDYVSCFKKVRSAFPRSKGFVFVADDCYAVQDFDMADIRFLKQLRDDIPSEPNSPNGWKRDQAKTRARLVADGYPTRDFTTHIPQWFEWDKLEALWKRYDMENESYVMEDLYYNIYYSTRLPMTIRDEWDNVKCALYFANIYPDGIRRAMERKIWLTNSPNGWTKDLDAVLRQYYFGE